MGKFTALAAALIIGVGALTACSGDGYCSELKSNFNAIQPGSDDTGPAVAKMKKIREMAPDEPPTRCRPP